MKRLLCCCLMLSLCGCKDSKNLLNILFPSSLVIDYQDGLYEIAFQIDNMNSIAKTELETSSENAKLLVATGKGKTIEDAILSIEENERSVINLSHIKSIILRPNTLSKDILKQICNYACFNQELRMDSEVYYTENEFTELFSTSFQLSRSELYILINSTEFQRVAMSMSTINIMQLSKSIDEVGITIHIPVLEVADTKDTYITQDGTEQQKVYQINDLLYLNNEKATQIPLDDLDGIQWTKTHQNNIELSIVDEKGEISAYTTRVSAYLFYNPKDKKYYLKGKASLVITRDTAYRSLEELEPLVKEKVHEQIMHTYQTGLENNTDVFNVFYQSLLFGKGTTLTSDNFVNDLDVVIHIKGSYVGAY